MQQKPNVVNGQGLDILEEFGIHVVDKERSSSTVSILSQSMATLRSKLSEFLPEDAINSILNPAEDLSALVAKWENKAGPINQFSVLIKAILTGFLINPTILDAFVLDAAKRILQAKNQDPAQSIIPLREARSAWGEILSGIKEG